MKPPTGSAKVPEHVMLVKLAADQVVNDVDAGGVDSPAGSRGSGLGVSDDSSSSSGSSDSSSDADSEEESVVQRDRALAKELSLRDSFARSKLLHVYFRRKRMTRRTLCSLL